jgi:hypothetical protein
LEAKKTGDLFLVDFFDAIKLLSKNPLGREITWDFIRANFESLVEEFGIEEPRLGQMVIDVCSTFENDFMLNEVNRHIIDIKHITLTINFVSINAIIY